MDPEDMRQTTALEAAFSRAGQAAPSGLLFRSLVVRLKSPEPVYELRSLGALAGPPDTLEDEDVPCVLVVARENDHVPFDPAHLPEDYPQGYLPPCLYAEEWAALFPGGPAMDSVRTGDRLRIEFLWDPAPEREGFFDFAILSATYVPRGPVAQLHVAGTAPQPAP